MIVTGDSCRYHSESGWQTLIEVLVEHYGLQVDQSAITVFVCLVPVIIDACVKLWVLFCSSMAPEFIGFRDFKLFLS